MANPWTAFYWKDYCSKTARLNLTEHGAYLMLMAEYYQTGAPLPASAEQLLHICRAFAKHEQEAVLSVIDKFFTLDGDVYRNERADKEIAKARQLSEKRRVAGKSGAKAKQANAIAIAKQVPEQLPTQPQPQPHKESIARKRATQLPDGYQPNEEHKRLAVEMNVNLREEFPKFRDHFKGTGKPKQDWDATLRNWIRNSKNYKQQTIRIPLETGVSRKNPAEEMRRQLEAD